VVEAGQLQTGKATQAIGVDRGAGRNVLLQQGGHGRGLEVRDHPHSDATRAVAPSFDGHKDRNGSPALELATPEQPGLWAADPGVVDLHVPVERFAGRVHHRAPQLVKHHPRGLIPAQAQLPLQQQRRDPPLVGRHEISGPEPLRQWHLRVVQNRPGCQRYLMPAPRALPASLFEDRVGAPVIACGHRNPSGHRHAARYCWPASSVEN